MYTVLCLFLVTFFRGQSRQRERAFTAPGTRTNHTNQRQNLPSSNTDTAKSRKRSYSAVLPRNLPNEALKQLLSISRHTSVLPEKSEESDSPEKHPEPDSHYITTQADFMKIEMKSLRKDSSRDASKRTGSARLKKGTKSNDTNSRQASKLPFIPDLPSEGGEAVVTKLTITVTKSVSQNSQNPGSSEPSSTLPLATGTVSSMGVAPNSPSHLTVVSLGPGNKKPAVERTSAPKTEYHGSRKGRLSQGWSPPQPIPPLKGSPIHKSVRIKEEVKDTSQLSPTTSMMIDVNVNEFLTDNS